MENDPQGFIVRSRCCSSFIHCHSGLMPSVSVCPAFRVIGFPSFYVSANVPVFAHLPPCHGRRQMELECRSLPRSVWSLFGSLLCSIPPHTRTDLNVHSTYFLPFSFPRSPSLPCIYLLPSCLASLCPLFCQPQLPTSHTPDPAPPSPSVCVPSLLASQFLVESSP